MKRDRRSVRDFRRMVSLNEYYLDRLNRLLDVTGGEEARLMYRAFKRGLDLLELDIESETRSNKK